MSGRFVKHVGKAAFDADRGGEFSGETDYGARRIDDLGIEKEVGKISINLRPRD